MLSQRGPEFVHHHCVDTAGNCGFYSYCVCLAVMILDFTSAASPVLNITSNRITEPIALSLDPQIPCEAFNAHLCHARGRISLLYEAGWDLAMPGRGKSGMKAIPFQGACTEYEYHSLSFL